MGDVWDYRALGGHDYEIRVDGRPELLVGMSTRVEAASLLMRELTVTIARHHGGTVAADCGPLVDWRKLGWTGRREHDERYAALQRTRAAWSDSALCGRLDAYVRDQMAANGIERGGPYSRDRIETLERIVARAPEVVTQDVAAEGVTA